MPDSSPYQVGSVCIPCLKKQLEEAKQTVRDNVAQEIIGGLSNQELARLPADLKKRLSDELSSGWMSDRDKIALNKLYDASKKAAIDLLKSSDKLSEDTKRLLDPKLIEGIYQAEGKRLSILEKVGIDGETIGRGQIGRDVYQDVMKVFKDDMLKKGGYQDITENYRDDLKNPILEDFATASSLALKIERSQRDGRSAEDVLKFGVGLYHGARNTLYEVQQKANDLINYSPVEKLLKSGSEKQKDIAAYIDEVTSLVR